MTTLDLEILQKYAETAERLRDTMRELIPYIEAMKAAELPNDRLIRAGEAAKILGVSQNKIGSFVKAGLLTPLYLDSNQKKFWLSQVRALPQKKIPS